MHYIIGPTFHSRYISVRTCLLPSRQYPPEHILVSSWRRPSMGDIAIAWTLLDRWIIIHRSRELPYDVGNIVEYDGLWAVMKNGWRPNKWGYAKVVPITPYLEERVFIASTESVMVIAEQWQHRVTGAVPVWRIGEQRFAALLLPRDNILDVIKYWSVQDMILDGWSRIEE